MQSTEYVSARIYNGIGVQKWTQMFEIAHPDIAIRVFKQGHLDQPAVILLFINYIKQQIATCLISYHVANGCAAYLDKVELRDAHDLLRLLKVDCEAKYLELFGKELLDTPTKASNKFFSQNSWTLSRAALLSLLAEKPAAFTAHVLAAKLETQKTILKLLEPETTDNGEIALIGEIEKQDAKLMELWRAMKKEDDSYEGQKAFRKYVKVTEME